MKSCDPKRRRQRRRERWKTTIGLISKRATLHMQHTFLYISLPLFCTTTTWNFQELLSHTFYAGNVVRFIVQFFSPPLIFTFHWWPLAFLIFSPSLQIFMVFCQQKMSPLFYTLALDLCHSFFSMSFAGLPPTFSFSLSFSFSILTLWNVNCMIKECETVNYNEKTKQ